MKTIGSGIFKDIQELVYLAIPDSITSIEDSAFAELSSLAYVSIPSSVTFIGIMAFNQCTSLKEITIPPLVTFIGKYAFKGCSSLEQLIIQTEQKTTPLSSIYINEGAFENCELMKKAVIMQNMPTVEPYLFKGCSLLSNIVFPSSFISIGQEAFSKCYSLKQIFIPSSVALIDRNAFCDCSLLTKIVILSPFVSFEEEVFNGISSLAIYGNLQKIPDNLFKGCNSLIQISIPSSVTEIGDYSFYECRSLTQIELPPKVASIGNFAFCGCSSLNQLVIPPSVTSIGDWAFLACSALTKLSIQSSIQKVGLNAFFGCPTMNDQNVKFLKIDDFNIVGQKFLGTYKNGYRAVNKITGKEYFLYVYGDFLSSTDFLKQIDISRKNIQGIVNVESYCFHFSNEQIQKIKRNTSYLLSGNVTASEYEKNGDIMNIMKQYLASKGEQNSILNPTIRSKIIFGVAAIMKKLHKNNIIHRNLKMSKILLDDNFEPIIITTCVAMMKSDTIKPEDYRTAPIYSAPEIIEDDKFDFPSDVFSFSIVLYFMFATNEDLKSNNIRTAYVYMRKIVEGKRLNKPSNIPDPYWELIEKCWDNDPNKRPTFDEITEYLKDDKYAINEFGMTTDLNQLHEYQKRIDNE
ncbi:hypothetical protein M9Y10_014446 [Tritrichomonas musculus]|uniref:Protein kinase domain-containing protein n=1 Tax=Tritrichomonas musculus TaxID=1915356 RepID=A0ABR2L0C2_9EUKA